MKRVVAAARKRRSTRLAIFLQAMRWRDRFVPREIVLGHALSPCPFSPSHLAEFLRSLDEGSYLLAFENFSNIAFFEQVENNDRYFVIHAECDRCRVHNFQTFADHV